MAMGPRFFMPMLENLLRGTKNDESLRASPSVSSLGHRFSVWRKWDPRSFLSNFSILLYYEPIPAPGQYFQPAVQPANSPSIHPRSNGRKRKENYDRRGSSNQQLYNATVGGRRDLAITTS
jgi:hypothetical protein